jgi:5-methylcytosine-specific restriction enzyme subunit McrC
MHIELTEHQTKSFLRAEIPETIIDEIEQNYSQQIKINIKRSKTGDRIEIQAKGWVGHIPLGENFQITILPKIPLLNLFQMLEYAYNIESFKLFSGAINCESIPEFYSYLANILAQKILERNRKGLYRTYQEKTEYMGALRGRFHWQENLKKPANVQFKCTYQEHTGDIIENQLLAWTLLVISRSSLCQEQAILSVRKAYHILQGIVTIKPLTETEYNNIKYSRLNQDYQPLHTLCKFFLAHSSPSHKMGNNTMLPFLINMWRLYELFVAEWLKSHISQDYFIKPQYSFLLNEHIKYRIDIMIYDKHTNQPRFILDTKYKDKFKKSDFDQIVSSATMLNCPEAILIYPQEIDKPFDPLEKNVIIRHLTFAIDKNIEESGQEFLNQIFR